MTRDQQLALLEIFIHEAERRSRAGVRDGNLPANLAAIFRETGFLLVVARLDDDVDLATYEAVGGDDPDSGEPHR